MADNTVGIRLSLSGQREATAGLNAVTEALGKTAGALETVARSAGGAAANITRMAGGKVMGAVRGLANIVTGVGAAAVATGSAMAVSLVRTGIGYNDLEQRAKAAFTTILGSQEAATKMMGEIRDFGRTSPFPRQAFITATQQLLGFGYQAEEIIPLLKTINDTTAAVGGNADTIATLTDVFAQIRSAGKVTTDDLNRMGAVGINGFQAIADATGKSIDQVRDDISAGNVDATSGVKALTDYMNKRFTGASDNVKKTWSGATDRIKGAWRDLGSAIVEPFVSTGGGGLAITWANHLADGLRKAANAAPLLISVLRTGKTDGAALAKILGPEAGGKLAQTMTNVRAAVLQIVRGFKMVDVNVNGSSTGLDLLVSLSGSLARGTERVVTAWQLFLRGLNDPQGVTSGSSPFIQFGATLRNTVDAIRDRWRLLVLGFTNSGYATSASNQFVILGAAAHSVLDYISGTWQLIQLGFKNAGGVTDQSSLWVQLGAAISQAFDAVRTFDWSNITGSVVSIGGSVRDLTPAWKAFHDSLPSFAVLGGAAGDALTVLAGVLRVLADHVDLLVKYAPLLVGLYAAWRIGSVIVAASVAISNARMIIGTTVTLANMAAMRQHTTALWANATAMSGKTRAELEAEVAGKRTLLQTIRARIATAASTIATKVWTVVTKAAAVATRLLGVAIRFATGPIGLIIIGVTLLVAALVWFFTKTTLGQKIVADVWRGIQIAVRAVVDWFLGTALPAILNFVNNVQTVFSTARTLLTLAWQGIKDAIWSVVSAVVQFVSDHWRLLLGILTGPIGLAVVFVLTHFDQIKAAAGALWDKVKDLAGKLKDFAENTLRSVIGGAIQFGVDRFNAIKDTIQNLIDKVRSVIDWFGRMGDKIRNLPGIGGVIDTVSSIIPGRAAGGPIYAGQPTLVGERGPEIILPQADGEVIPNHRLAAMASTDAGDLNALANATTGTQVIQLVVDRKVLAQATVGGLAADEARR